MTPPCMDCCQRHYQCHDICDSYKEYKEYRQAISHEMSVEKEINVYTNKAVRQLKFLGRRS